MQITGEHRGYFFDPFVTMKEKKRENRKEGGGEQKVEKTNGKYQVFLRLSKAKTSRDCLSVSAPFPATRSAEKKTKPKLKPVKRKGRRHKAKHKRQTQTENKGKRDGTDEHGQTSQRAFNIAAAPSFFSRSIIQFLHAFLSCMCYCSSEI